MKKVLGVLSCMVILSLILYPALTVRANPDSSLVALWHFDEGSGTTAYDSSGNGNDGTLTSDSVWISGQDGFGAAVKLKDVDEEYVEVDNESSFDFEKTDAFTLAAWVKIPSGVGRGAAIISKWDEGIGYEFSRKNENNGNVLSMELWATWGKIKVEGSTPLTDGNWHYLTVTYDGSSLAAGIQIYVDGVPETMVIAKDKLDEPDDSILNDVPLLISGHKYRIDEVSVWNRVLTAYEIAQCSTMGPVSPVSKFKITSADIDFPSAGDNDSRVRVIGEFNLEQDDVNVSDDIIVTVGEFSDGIPGDTVREWGYRWMYNSRDGFHGHVFDWWKQWRRGHPGEPYDEIGTTDDDIVTIIDEIEIDWRRGRFEFSMNEADLSSLADPYNLLIRMWIGNDVGEATIQTRQHWDYSGR